MELLPLLAQFTTDPGNDAPLAFHLEFVVAIITLTGVIITGLWAYISKREATGANRAVNNRAPGEPAIYDMLRDTHDAVVKSWEAMDEVRKEVKGLQMWRASYSEGPLDSGAKVDEFVRRVDRIDTDLGKLSDDVEEIKTLVKQGKDAITRYDRPVHIATDDRPVKYEHPTYKESENG